MQDEKTLWTSACVGCSHYLATCSPLCRMDCCSWLHTTDCRVFFVCVLDLVKDSRVCSWLHWCWSHWSRHHWSRLYKSSPHWSRTQWSRLYSDLSDPDHSPDLQNQTNSSHSSVSLLTILHWPLCLLPIKKVIFFGYIHSLCVVIQ